MISTVVIVLGTVLAVILFSIHTHEKKQAIEKQVMGMTDLDLLLSKR